MQILRPCCDSSAGARRLGKRVACAATATHIGFINQPGLDASAVTAWLTNAGLGFPVVAKPDLGWCGYGVRLLASATELADYLRRFPCG